MSRGRPVLKPEIPRQPVPIGPRDLIHGSQVVPIDSECAGNRLYM